MKLFYLRFDYFNFKHFVWLPYLSDAFFYLAKIFSQFRNFASGVYLNVDKSLTIFN